MVDGAPAPPGADGDDDSLLDSLLEGGVVDFPLFLGEALVVGLGSPHRLAEVGLEILGPGEEGQTDPVSALLVSLEGVDEVLGALISALLLVRTRVLVDPECFEVDLAP